MLLLGSAEFGGEIDDQRDPDRQQLLERINQLRQTIATAADQAEIDTALLRLERIDPGLVHAADLQRVQQHRWHMPIRIAVLHHPVSPLPVSLEVSRYGGLLNAGQVKDALLGCGFCLVLHGHLHSGWFAAERWPARHGDRTLHIAAAPSLGSREIQEHNGYNEIEIRWEGDAWNLTVRRIIRDGGTWKPVDEPGLALGSEPR